MNKLTPDDQLLCAVVVLKPTAQELAQIDALLPQVQNWERTITLLTQHGSAPLLHVKLPLLANAHCIPPQWVAHVQQVYFKSLSRGMLLYNLFREVVTALQQHNIDIIVLKGAYLSECVYGDIALRQFSDIDILVHEADGPRSIDILRNIGFVPWESKGISEFIDAHSDFVHYRPMQKGDVSVEIHIKLHTRSKKYKLSIPHIWERSVPCVIQGLQVRALCTDDLLMHLCVHADKHFEKGELSLKSMNDFVAIVAQLPDNYDWMNFLTMCAEYDCRPTVCSILVLVGRYYPTAIPRNFCAGFKLYLSTETTEKFERYLRGEIQCESSTQPQSAVPGHLNSLRNIESKRLFVRYLLEVIVPGKSFMMQKYRLHRNFFTRRFWWLWYGYRWWVGVKGLI